MKNFSFVVWMLVWPMLFCGVVAINRITNSGPSDTTLLISGIAAFLVWVGIGYLVYEPGVLMHERGK
jgi:hypothetical protein